MHLAAYYSAAVTNTAGTHRVPAVQDGYLNVQNEGFLLPRQMGLYRWSSFASVSNRMFLRHPKWRNYGDFETDKSLTVTTNQQALSVSYPDGAVVDVPPNESLELHYQRGTLGASAVLLGISVGNDRQSSQPVVTFPVYALASITHIAGVWAESPLTFAATLPSGNYLVQGLDCYATTGGLARLRFNNQENMPGNWVRSGLSSSSDRRMLFGYYGPYGRFNQSTPPTIQYLTTTSATTTVNVVMQLTKA